MSAKEMFEKLGYEQRKLNDVIHYLREHKGETVRISFYLPVQKYECDMCSYPLDISMQLNKAIQQQIKELGWESDK